jgi:hypothetical protein
MSTKPLKFKRTELRRAFQAIVDTGAQVDRIEVSPSGTLRIFPKNPLVPAETLPTVKTTLEQA